MKSPLVRLLALGFGIAVVLSCDSTPLTAPGTVGASASGAAAGTDKTPPIATIDTPATGGLVNVGDSILVVMHLQDDRALGSLMVGGYTETGSIGLGTFSRVPRYAPITVPAGGVFRSGLRDTVIRRYLQPAQPVDTTLDSLVVIAFLADSAGNLDSTQVVLHIVAGPKVNFVTPSNGDSVPAGVGMTVTAGATSNTGITTLSFRVQGGTTWPTKLDTTITQSYPPNTFVASLSGIVAVPSNAPLGGRITVTSTAVDINGQPGSPSPISVIVRSNNNAQPLVTQSVLPLSEIGDSITITANGGGIAMLGFVVRDSTGTQIQRDSVPLVAPYASNVVQALPLSLPVSTQGTKIFIYSFAKDQAGRVGFSVKAGIALPQSVESAAYTDSVRVAYGETFALPRSGSTVADIAVDPVYGNVFLSNTNYNLLEVWNNQTQTFSANGVAVGSQPWGMDISKNPGVLLVANSGGTNISQVNIASSNPAGISEIQSQRILTRNTVVYTLTQTQTPTVDSAGDTTITWHSSFTGPFSYSDRPQFVQQGAGGLIYYSTEPTTTATPGTIRVLDPTQAVADPRQIWQYGALASDQSQIAIFNIDYLTVILAPTGSVGISDLVYACDHTPGTANAEQCVTDSTAAGIATKLVAAVNSDIQEVTGLDVTSLGLHDTTFVARSANRNWIGFGEGNTQSAAGRIIMAQDAATFNGIKISGSIPIQDVLNNASDVVNAMAIDSTGQLVAAHGALGGYFASIQSPLTLRLQGSYATNTAGAGIAFDPGANGYTTDGTDQLAFIASGTGMISIVDVYHFNNRGTLKLKYPMYGPLRATRPLPGDPASVVLKLYGMTANGLVVINLRASDIQPPAP